MSELLPRLAALMDFIEPTWRQLFGGRIWLSDDQDQTKLCMEVSRDAIEKIWLVAEPSPNRPADVQEALESLANLIGKLLDEYRTSDGLATEIITAWNRLSFLNDMIALMRVTTNPREQALKSLRLVCATIQVENAFMADAGPQGVTVNWVNPANRHEIDAELVKSLQTKARNRLVCNSLEECQNTLSTGEWLTSFLGQRVYELDSVNTFIGLINHTKGSFDAGDMQIFDSLIQMMAAFFESGQLHDRQRDIDRLDRDLKLAEEIQTGLLPLGLPELMEYNLSAEMVPAARLGGDFYDIVDQGAEYQAVVVCDVAGKGIPAALMAAELRAVVRSKVRNITAPGQILAETNIELFDDMERSERFATMVLVQVPKGGSGELQFASAGHTNCLSFGGDPPGIGRFESTTYPLGILSEIHSGSQTITLNPGESLLIYSDGLTEARDGMGKLIGEEGVIEVLLAVDTAPAAFIIESLLEKLWKYSNGMPLSDDLTMVIIQRRAANPVAPIYLDRFLLPGKLESLSDISLQIRKVESYLPGNAVGSDWLTEVQLAIQEAAANIVLHAYKDANLTGEIHGLIALYPDRLDVCIVDAGQPYMPRVRPEPIQLDEGDLQEGGYGLHIIQSVMSRVDYQRIANTYNRWLFTRNLGASQTHE